MAGIGGEQQLQILALTPKKEHDLIPGGLVDLVDLSPHHGPAKLLRHGGQAQCV